MRCHYLLTQPNGIQIVGTLLPPANEVCEGYVFTPVCHSVHRGSTWAGNPPGRYTPQAGTPLGRYIPPGRYTPWAGIPLDRYTPGRYTSLGRYTPLQVHPPAGTPPWAGTPPGRYTPQTVHVGIRSTSGRYASYWNAFLFVHLKMSSSLWPNVEADKLTRNWVREANGLAFLGCLQQPLFYCRCKVAGR